MFPFGDERTDVGFAIVARTVANMLRGKKGKPAKLEDFIPKFDRPRRQTWQQQKQFVEMLNAALGGKDQRSGNTSDTHR